MENNYKTQAEKYEYVSNNMVAIIGSVIYDSSKIITNRWNRKQDYLHPSD